MATMQSKSVRRREDAKLLTGKGNYSADAHPPGMLHAVLVRSHHAHAAIDSIDTTAARAMPGVVAVFTAADLTDVAPIPGGIGFPRPDGGPAPKTDRPLLAADRVRFVGEPVAVVLAETMAAGKDAAEAVMVDYRELPLVTDPVAAMQPGAPTVWDDVPDNIGFLWKRGDAGSDGRRRCAMRRMSRGCSSPSRASPPTRWSRAAPGREIGSDGRMVVHAAHQSPFNLRNGMANGNFNIKPTDIRVLCEDVGGSFGMKSGVQPEYVLVAWAARKLQRPVRWIEDRTEGFLTDEQAREMRITVELALDAEHKFTALKLRWDVNLGAYVTGRSGWPVGNIGGTAGVYRHPGDLRGSRAAS